MHKIRKKAQPLHFFTWKEDFKSKNGKEPSYSDLKGEEKFRLKKALLEEQGYVCCYCENAIGRNQSFSDCDIEHFMPRNPDRHSMTAEEYDKCREAQLSYDNMLVSCKGEESVFLDHCNHKKDNWYDSRYCISPILDGIETLFKFRINGKIMAAENNICAEVMLEHLNLDTYVLREQRKNAYDFVLEWEMEEEELLGDEAYIANTIAYYKGMDEKGEYAPFCSMITYCLENYLL